MILYLLADDLPWFEDLSALAGSLREPDGTPGVEGDPAGPGRSDAASAREDVATERALAGLYRALVERRCEDLWVAAADALLYGASPAWSGAHEAPGIAAVLARDVHLLIAATAAASAAARRRGEPTGADTGPDVARLAPPAGIHVAALASSLRAGVDPRELVEQVLRFRREQGGGPLGRYLAYRWNGRDLVGVAAPVRIDAGRLVGLDHALAPLETNTAAFLDGRPAMHALLYGPRGSGKSTAVRSLLTRHAERGLRLVELAPGSLPDLPAILTRLAGRPERFLLFVDDLSFGTGDDRYAPLKSLLEGGVAERPANVRLYATSNRRHLVQERLRDRPDPLDDDVHAWDTQHERLALADRFGLLVTFPAADQRRYLEIVRHLAEVDGLDDADLDARADRFARHGNGYSGRTAQQFVDAARSGLA